jgi:hypothetical protein
MKVAFLYEMTRYANENEFWTSKMAGSNHLKKIKVVF